MKKIFLIGFIGLFLGCSSSISKEDLSKLDGYWEITQVTLPDGKTKEYKVNTSIDYISINGEEGYRKKMQPRLDGTYATSDDAEAFVISKNENNFSIDYKTELSEWSEKLVELDDTTFSVVNEEGIRYDYKRFEPISIQ
ncbi:hypothetical protein D9O36_08350 [Zobellia amurskyensis]|uniref:Lipocalin-like domain-containing protein n=1 Tax=Zobellia amurskyensis TaxID=248905 RepID=A0A7X2ZSZ8_9FLAO|nr:lipocalin family protein [Zobellia amurskyensis]MUH35847.1 hypothetical protein [Zobellia amurskyensis]